MYPKFKEISLDTATWTVAFLGAIEERETKSKKPFCTFHLLDGAIAIIANLWNTEKKDIYKVQEKSVISVQLYKKLYNGVETYEVKEYQAAPDDAKLEDYLLTAPIPSQDMMDEIKSILSKEISETELYPLVMEILDENADKLLYWAAAKTIHHNCYGACCITCSECSKRQSFYQEFTVLIKNCCIQQSFCMILANCRS